MTYRLFDDFEDGLFHIAGMVNVDFAQSRQKTGILGEEPREEGSAQLLILLRPTAVLHFLAGPSKFLREKPDRRLDWITEQFNGFHRIFLEKKNSHNFSYSINCDEIKQWQKINQSIN